MSLSDVDLAPFLSDAPPVPHDVWIEADMCAVFDNVIPQVPSISATPSTYSFPSRQAGPGPEPIYTTRPLLHPGQENDSYSIYLIIS